MEAGTVTVNYTQLVWINVKGAPKEISDVFEPDEKFKLKYRIEFQEEAEFNMENSVIRRKDDLIAITFRGEQDLPLFGNMRMVPFTTFHCEFHFELSHFEMKVDGVHSQIRYNLHKNNVMNSMIGIKCEAK